MRHWRLKIVCCLIFYCGGFLTAVYVLAPSRAAAQTGTQAHQSALGHVDTQAWAAKVRGGINQAIRFAEDNALRAAAVIAAHTGQSE